MRQRVQSILTNLEAVGEDLLALSDDIWLNSEHNDNEPLAEGVRAKTAFNEQVAEFQGVAERLSGLVEDFSQVRTFDAPEAPGSAEERERPTDEIRFGSSSRWTSACRMGSTRTSATNARRCSAPTARPSTALKPGRRFTAS
jgi:hypothetical protein